MDNISTKKEQSKKPHILIVGGVAGGAACAARLRRLSEDAEIIVFERGPSFHLPTAASHTMWGM